jgi:hypothetical protein
MMIRRQHMGQGTTEPAQIFNIEGLRIVRTNFKPGEWVITKVPEQCSYQDWESVHVHLKGTSSEINNSLPSINHGWVSRHDPYVMEPGIYKRVFDSPTEYWCCLWTDGRGCEDVQVIKLQAGESCNLLLNQTVFVLNGTGVVNSTILQEHEPVKLISGSASLTATTEFYALTW